MCYPFQIVYWFIGAILSIWLNGIVSCSLVAVLTIQYIVCAIGLECIGDYLAPLNTIKEWLESYTKGYTSGPIATPIEGIQMDKETQTVDFGEFDFSETVDRSQHVERQSDESSTEDVQSSNSEEHQIQLNDDSVGVLQPPINGTWETMDEAKDSEDMAPIVDGLAGADRVHHVMSSTEHMVALARSDFHDNQEIRGLEDRVQRLEGLLSESDEEHKRKDSELEQIQIYSQYLKHSLLQYCDGKIAVKQMLQIAAVGLDFSEEEKKKANSSKLVIEETSTWW